MFLNQTKIAKQSKNPKTENYSVSRIPTVLLGLIFALNCSSVSFVCFVCVLVCRLALDIYITLVEAEIDKDSISLSPKPIETISIPAQTRTHISIPAQNRTLKSPSVSV